MPAQIPCRILQADGYAQIRIPQAGMGRLCILLDGLETGLLSGLTLADKSAAWVCRCDAAGDRIDPRTRTITLSAETLSRIRRLLLDVTLNPVSAAWQHTDVSADGGDWVLQIDPT